MVIRCENSRSMTISGAPICMACSSFSFRALRASLRMCETSTILRLMASICCSEWVASLACHSCSRLVASSCFFLSLAALLASFLSESPLPSSCCCCCFPCSIAAAASPLERRRLSLRGRNPFCPFPHTARPPPPPPLHNLLALLSWNLLLFTISKPRS